MSSDSLWLHICIPQNVLFFVFFLFVLDSIFWLESTLTQILQQTCIINDKENFCKLAYISTEIAMNIGLRHFQNVPSILMIEDVEQEI